MKLPIKITRFIRPRNIVLIFITLAVLLISSALVELDHGKEELLELMENQSHDLLETLFAASQNSILSNEYLDLLLKERLLNNAYFVKRLYEQQQIDNRLLLDIAEVNHIYRINIFDRNGRKIFSSHRQRHYEAPEKFSPRERLKLLFEGVQDTLILGIREARSTDGYRFVVAVAARDHSVIVLNLDAETILAFREKVGFEVLLKRVMLHPGIIYAVLQDTAGLLTPSAVSGKLEEIRSSPFLSKSLSDSSFESRIAILDSLRVFEAVHPFAYKGKIIGLFRLGLSLDPIDEINQRTYQRMGIITVVLIVLGFILVMLILVQQYLDDLQRKYREVETYSSNILKNVSDAIVMIDNQANINLFNKAAESLFQRSEKEVFLKPLAPILGANQCREILHSQQSMFQLECDINGKKKYLLVSRSHLLNGGKDQKTIMVIRDLTEQRELERQIQRKERLSAMGELASGVAHEIRNPLNTIGTIVQQLDKDFEPPDNGEEYHQLTGLVYQEVRRINQTVQDFLRFARPQPLNLENFVFSEFLKQIHRQYQPLLDKHQIRYRQVLEWDGSVRWDKDQIRQVLMNLLQNAVDALENGGEIAITVKEAGAGYIELRVSDNGPGIPEALRSKIFNLYFTTKSQGTGVGLSLVQRIIDEHGGVIFVESEENRGTTVVMRLPRKVR